MDLDWLFKGKRVLVGVTGGIAAYKAAELVRLLVRSGAEVQCVMTDAGARFVTPLTLEALTGRKTLTDLFQLGVSGQIQHIEAAGNADLMIIAPATANTLAKLAHGLAPDMVSALALSCRCRLLLAPGMNVNMWSHPATRQNVQTLVDRGCLVVGPEAGELACGTTGMGRMSEPVQILEAAAAALVEQDLMHTTVLVTAGATREPLDPVRFLSNRSTGRMGFAVARAAAARGGRTRLVAGPGHMPAPFGVELERVQTAAEMHRAVMEHAGRCDVIVKAAAVADFRPETVAPEKLAKKDMAQTLSVTFVRNPDILAELGTKSQTGAEGDGPPPLLVGFAAETGPEAERRGLAKLKAKGCHMIVINDVTQPGAGFGTETNRAVLLEDNGKRQEFDLMSKDELAHRLCRRIAERLKERGTTRSG